MRRLGALRALLCRRLQFSISVCSNTLHFELHRFLVLHQSAPRRRLNLQFAHYGINPKRALFVSPAVLALGLCLAPNLASANATGLQVNPLKYVDKLTSGQVKSGYIDVSNPGDTTVTIMANVESFRQTNLNGDLQFYPDARLSAGIKPDLPQFDLGPRQAIRVAFSVDSSQLPQGGVYAAIFFRTVPPVLSSNTSYISESANVGTLLILQNGPPGAHIGEVTTFNLPFWQFGSGLVGQLQYRNTNHDVTAAAFNPTLASRIFSWGHRAQLAGPFILPQATRQFGFSRPGSFIGLLPVAIVDATSGRTVTRWVFAATGLYPPLLVLLAVLLGLRWNARHQRWTWRSAGRFMRQWLWRPMVNTTRSFWRWLKR